jgi:hypothetical protein
MYQFHVQVREHIGSCSVTMMISDTDDQGDVVVIAKVPEQFFEDLSLDGDPLMCMFDSLERFARKCRSARRVASGGS